MSTNRLGGSRHSKLRNIFALHERVALRDIGGVIDDDGLALFGRPRGHASQLAYASPLIFRSLLVSRSRTSLIAAEPSRSIR